MSIPGRLAITLAAILCFAAPLAVYGSWGAPTRILWADPDKDALASGELREVQFRVSPQHKDWDQWSPSRAGGQKSAEEIARAVSKGFAPDDVYVAEILISPIGCTEVEMATLDPPHHHGESGQPPHRHRSVWSNRIVLGECLVPTPDLIQASEPSSFALLMTGLPVLMLIAYLRT